MAVKTKVLIVTDATLDGGTNTLIYNQLCVAKERPDFCVSVLLDNNANMMHFREKCESLGVPVYLENIYHGNNTEPQIQKAIHKILKEINPDVVHVYRASIRSSIAIQEYVLSCGLPLVITEAYLPQVYPITEEQLSRVKEIYSKAKAAIMVCQTNITVMRDIYGITEWNFHYIPTSIDTRTVKPARCEIRRPMRALLLGRLTRQKGMDIFIEAFRRLTPAQKQFIQADICGEGEDRQALQNLLDRYALNSHIRLLGYQTDILDRTSEFDLAIIPSRDEGGLPHVVLELLAAGLPCIVSNISGLQEAAGYGECALTFAPESFDELKERLVTAIESPTVLIQKAERAGSYLKENYERERNYERVLHLWKTSISALSYVR